VTEPQYFAATTTTSSRLNKIAAHTSSQDDESYTQHIRVGHK